MPAHRTHTQEIARTSPVGTPSAFGDPVGDLSVFRLCSDGYDSVLEVPSSSVSVRLGELSLPTMNAARRALTLDGVWVPLTTPFKNGGRISWDGLSDNLAKYEQIPFAGYVVAGSNGEAPYLSPEERVALVKAVRSASKKPIIGGATAESTVATCQLAGEIAEAGADGLLVMPPFYFRKRMTDEALSHHFKSVAEHSKLPIVIYNMPFVTGIDLSISTLSKLAQHELIVGVKDSDIRKCTATVQETRGLNFEVLIGSAGYLLGALLAGCAGGINGLAGIMGAHICNIHSLFKCGKIQEASEIQNKIAKADILFMAEQGVAGLKAGMDMVGLAGGDCRLPILPLSAEDRARIQQFIHTDELLSKSS